MDRRILAIVLALVAVAVAVGIGTQLYQAGVARGLAESGQITRVPRAFLPTGITDRTGIAHSASASSVSCFRCCSSS